MAKKDNPDYRDAAGYFIYDDGALHVWDDFGDDTHLTKSQAYELHRGLSRQYEEVEEEIISPIIKFSEQRPQHRKEGEGTGTCEDCGSTVVQDD